MDRIKRFLYSIYSLFFLAGFMIPIILACADPTSDAHFLKFNIQGKVQEHRYYGYKNFFSIAMPTSSTSSEIEDFYAAPNSGGVAFFNHSGFLLKLEIDQLPPEVTYLISHYPEIKLEILDALFEEILYPQLKSLVPKLQILHRQRITLADNEEASFASLDLPEMATLVDLDSGRNLDSKRGFLLFFAKDNKELVYLSLQDSLSLIPNIAEAAKARLNERLLNHLIQYQATFRLEK